MPKITALPSMTSPDTADPAPVVDDSAIVTKKLTLGGLRDWLYGLVNIPAGPGSPVTRDNEHFLDYVASGLVLSGDSYGSNRNASMTSGVCYINGRRIALTAVNARTYTASRDTYVDVLDNQDGTGTLVYTEVTNNAASPALAANSIRIGIIVTGASTIANVGSVNQGQNEKVLPIASGIPYTTADSLGNIICSRDPQRRTLNYKQMTSNQTGIGTSATQITPFSLAIKVPTLRKIKLKVYCWATDSTTTSTTTVTIWDGTVGSGTQVGSGLIKQSAAGNGTMQIAEIELTPSATSKTYNIGLSTGSGTAGIYSSVGSVSFAKAELA